MDTLKIIKQSTKELIEKMGFEVDFDIDAFDQNNIIVNIKTDEAGFLIGQSGGNLQAIQHLVRVLVNKKLGFPAQFIIDINNYQKHQIELLKDLANNIARQALDNKISFFLRPMPAHERRIIHLALADHPEVDTESIGEGLVRQVVIKPKNP